MEDPMIRLSFNTLQSISTRTIGPAPYFRIDRQYLCQGPLNDVVAQYRQHHWEIDGAHLSSYECRDRTCVHFEDGQGNASERTGPYTKLHFPNGSCYADEKRIAEYVEDTQTWIRCADCTRWSVLVVSPA
jgi:hypothetical protein